MLKKAKGWVRIMRIWSQLVLQRALLFSPFTKSEKKSGLIYFFKFLVLCQNRWASEVLLSPGSKKVEGHLVIFVSFLDFVGFLDLVALLDIVDLLYIPRSHFGPLGSFVPFGSFRTHGSFGLVRLYWHGGLFGPFGLHWPVCHTRVRSNPLFLELWQCRNVLTTPITAMGFLQC